MEIMVEKTKQGKTKTGNASIEDSIGNNFGTFKGVFIPSILTILGVIMYLRIGWVLGHVGLFQTILIVTISSMITLFTALSISATATNMKVGGGGAYFMISRSLGVEAGAAIGVPLFFAQALGIAFYLAGFSESLQMMFPDLPIVPVSAVTLLFLTGLALVSADLALKAQFVIFGIILLSLISFFIGGGEPAPVDPSKILGKEVGFWTVFAVFFPAVTGILTGVSMSGDLKSPEKSLPYGTLAAVIVGYIVYISIPTILAYNPSATQEQLLYNPMVMTDLAWVGMLVIFGLWGATLSSALGNILGAPRTLQALAKDKVVFSLFGKGMGKNDDPRYATALTFLIALGGIFLGDLNAIAPVLSMFFLTSYGMLNLSAGIEGMIANPSWRPAFRVHWTISILGAFGCFAVMFMINPGATIISIILVFSIFYVMQRRKLNTNFGDMRRGILMFLARSSISALANLKENSKSWRPNILVLSGTPTKRWYLVELANDISHGKGFLTVATILLKSTSAVNRLHKSQKTIEDFMKKRGIPALVRVSVADDVISGTQSLVRDYGLGPIYPNTIILGETENEENYTMFAEMLIRIYQAERNIIIIRESDREETNKGTKRIDVWWGRERHNAGFSLAIGFMLQSSHNWLGAELYLKSIATKSTDHNEAEQVLEAFLEEGRLDAKARVYDTEGDKFAVFDKIREKSGGADLVFIGMQTPNLELFKEDPQKVVAEYAEYYRELLKLTQDFPTCGIVLAAEDIDFHKIFSS